MSKTTDKGKPIFGLKKIPKNELLKLANIEIGKLRAYIDELEFECENLRKDLADWRKMSESEKSQARQAYYTKNILEKQRKQQIENLELKNKKLKREYDTLFHQYVILRKENDRKL